MRNRIGRSRFGISGSVFCASVVLLFFGVGCGSKSAPAHVPAEETPGATAAVTKSSDTQTKTNASPATASAKPKKNDGRRMIGDIPLDVWYDDPLQVAASGGNVNPAPAENPASATTPNMVSTSDVPAVENTEPATPAAGGWNEMISGETISKEVTSITNFMRTKLQSMGTFKQAIFQLPAKSATLSVLAHIGADHPDDIRWKKNARYIRDLAASMHQDKLQPSRKFYDPIATAYESIGEIMSGSSPSGDAPEESADFSDLAEMRLLMMRMEIARDTMKTEAGNEEAFKANIEMIQHESAVLGVLMKVCLAEGFGYGDDEDFLAFAKPIMDSTKQMQDAVETGDFETYDASLSRIFQSCTECHTEYKNN